jgi:sec-independent protein translocase protein TatB
VFGLSFGEFVVLIVVALVVVGPRNLPSLLRNAGQLIGKLRRMAVDLRADSGIDDILREEGLREEYEKFRRLASGAVPIEDDPKPTTPAAEAPAAPVVDPYATPGEVAEPPSRASPEPPALHENDPKAPKA